MFCKPVSIMLVTILLILTIPVCSFAASPLNSNIITDGSFETGAGVTVDNTYTFISSDEARTGNNSAKITITNGTQISKKFDFYLTNLIHRAQYTLSVWYKGSMTSGKGFGAGFYCYANNTFNVSSERQFFHTKAYAPTSAWTELSYTFTCPDDANAVRMYLDFTAANGVIYVDDLSLSMTAEPEKFTMNTDNVFYYSDWETGIAEVTLDPYYPEESFSVVFNIMDGENSLARYETASTNRKAFFEFNISLLSQKKKQYFVTADIYDTDGTLVNTVSEEIYRYDRPTQMNENGEFIEKGKVFHPVIGYRIPPDKYEISAKAGFNVVGWQFDEDIETSIRELDEMYAHGFLAAVVCYWSMYPAGNPRNIERVAPYVEAVKNHPAIFCYMVMDEPYYNDPINATPDLRASYKMLRGIDDEHPVYIVESIPNKYPDSGKYSDYLAIDPYPGNGLDYGTHVGNSTLLARAAVANKKPVLNVLQAFSFGLSKPTTTELHSMIYQALLGGSQGLGYFWLTDNAMSFDSIFPDNEYDTLLTDFYKNEHDIMFEHFSSGNSPYFAKSQKSDLWYEIWECGDSIYAAVQNRLNVQNRTNIPLINTEEDTIITDYNISVISSAQTAVKAHNGSFTVTLAPRQAVLIKFSNITTQAYFPPSPLPPVITNGDFDRELNGWASQNSTVKDGYAILENGSLSQSFSIINDKASYKIEFDYTGSGTFDAIHNSTNHISEELPQSDEWTYFSRVLRLDNNANGTVTLSFGGSIYLDNVIVSELTGYDFDNLITDPGFEYYADKASTVSDITVHPDGILPWTKKSYIVTGGTDTHPLIAPSGDKMWHIPNVSGGAIALQIDSDTAPGTNAYKDTGLTLSFDLYRTAPLPFGIWIELVSTSGSDGSAGYNGANGSNSKTAVYHTDYHPTDAPKPGEWTRMSFDLSKVLKDRTPDLYDTAYRMNLIFMTGYTSLYIDNISLTSNSTHLKLVNRNGQVLSSLPSFPCDIIADARYFTDTANSAKLIIASFLPNESGKERLCSIKVKTIHSGECTNLILEDESNHGGKMIKAFLWMDGVPLKQISID